MNQGPFLQVLNENTKKILSSRLIRDELIKKMLETRLELYRTNILIENERYKIDILRQKAYTQLYESYQKNRRNNIQIELEHRKITEMKLGFITQIIQLDKDNQNLFNAERETKISTLTDNMNYETPDSWDENKAKFQTQQNTILAEIRERENELIGLIESPTHESKTYLIELLNKQVKLNSEVESLVERILPLNDTIADEIEEHEVTNVKVSDLSDAVRKTE